MLLLRETEPQRAPKTETPVEIERTLASRFIFLALCMTVVLSTLAYGTVYYWSLAIFQAGAALIIALWAVDAWRTNVLRVSRNALQLPLAEGAGCKKSLQ